MSRIPIVDEHDVIIGYKLRTELQPGDIHRAAGLWLLNEKGEVLIAQRAFTKPHSPGRWGPSVAGTVEEGETYESNIIKEAREELGLELQHYTVGNHYSMEAEQKFFGQWFSATIPSTTEFILQEEEVAAVKWVSPEWLRQEVQKPSEFFSQGMEEYVKAIPLP